MINEINETFTSRGSVARRKGHVCNGADAEGNGWKITKAKNWGPFIAHVPRFFTPLAIRTFMISFKLHGPLFDWKYYFGKLTVGETKEGKRRGIRVFLFFSKCIELDAWNLQIWIHGYLFHSIIKEMIEFFLSLSFNLYN